MTQSAVVLYVEDDPLSRQVLSFLLTNVMGCSQPVVWEDSSQFTEKLSQLAPKPDVIFVDIHMGPLNGFEMLKIIRQHHELRTTPVIALTASVMSEEVKVLKEAGFSGAVAKPINMETFPETFGRILKGELVWRVA